MAKKKDQEKFTEYSNNTNDAWEIDDRTMTLKIADDNDNSSKYLSKKLSTGKESTSNFTDGKSLSRQVGQSSDNNAQTSRSTNSNKTNLITMMDINRQKENKFQQIFDQSTVDLSKTTIRSIFNELSSIAYV